MGLRLQPRDTRFFVLFANAGTHVSECCEVLREFVAAPTERRPELADRMHQVEHAGDQTTHEILELLNRAFITPFDREDIYRLAERLDDVIDFIDGAVDLANLYRLGELPSGVHEQVDLLCQMARLTTDAMRELAKPASLDAYWVKVNELENQADQVNRKLLSWMFGGDLEPLEVMKLKEIVDELESAADAFEHVANAVHTIAVKES
ncbi:MAG TPA: DUF47 family protein [Actinophytocola sp.]|uniref:DUF47 domain-containing protein n=1 Tax=Actinophytocola sp. TaxID=1872138 RepID=UPI002DC03468|nr:DUF47 family protein [Actinophytocola sp.]HEU5472616.1 DUF47 family protein [Actinophytocola sp.]